MAKQQHYRIGRSDIEYRAARMEDVLNRVKEAALKPDAQKKAPRFSQALAGEILGLTKSQMLYRFQEGKFKGGARAGSRTLYTVEELREFARAEGLRHEFAEGHGLCICVANFKGGVAKTSTTVTLAQYLSLRGYNVCVIDMDPQASATTLFGVSPYLDVTLENGVFALFDGENVNLDALIRPTYWPGVDLMAANQFLYRREFALAAAGRDWGGEIFEYLQQSIVDLRKRYDVILIDTQPSLGFLTSISIYGAEHLLVTVPPSNLDFASSVMFWRLLADIMGEAQTNGGHPKFWEGVHVLQTRVDEQDKSSQLVRKLLAMGCEDWLLPDVIPATRVATTAASEFATVYDVEKYEGSHRSIKRARESFDKAYAQIRTAIEHTWSVAQNPNDYEVITDPLQEEIPFRRELNTAELDAAAVSVEESV